MPSVAAVRTAVLLTGALLGASLQAHSGAPAQDPQRPVFSNGHQSGPRRRNDIDSPTQDGVSVARRGSAIGDPLLFRLATPTSPRPAGSTHFRRTERIRVQWPLDGDVQERTARLLGRHGVPLQLPVAVSDNVEDGVTFLVTDLTLAPLTAGDYVLQVTGTVAGQPATAMPAFRVGR
jgi:hypothetical protein